MLRLATEEDFDLVYKMGISFLKQTEYEDISDDAVIREVITDYIAARGEGKVILLHGDVGMIMGMVFPFAFGTCLQATEVAWWVEPEHRKSSIGAELLDAFEYWAKKLGASVVSMAALDDKLEKYYIKRGYRLSEHIYRKDL